eukprot:m.100619 g.100619  ORF g.100619 m.100619 type:complete len:68 (+) comp9047_c8_seq2:4832-5035(+)
MATRKNMELLCFLENPTPPQGKKESIHCVLSINYVFIVGHKCADAVFLDVVGILDFLQRFVQTLFLL